jgi:hypothetical protein
MKVTESDYQTIREAMRNVVKPFGLSAMLQYEKDLIEDSRVKDLDTRLAWDIFWAIGKHTRTLILDRVHAYDCNDDHLNTAFKKALKEIWIDMEVEQVELNSNLRNTLRHQSLGAKISA